MTKLLMFAVALLLIPLTAQARNQVWNQATWVVAASGGSDTLVYKGALGFIVGDAAACSVAVTPLDQSTSSVLTNLQPGEIVPIAVSKINQTSTTCTAVFVLGATGN